MWARLWNKLTFLYRRGQIERDLAEELEFHRRMLEADHERAGVGRDAAALGARRRMGNTTLAREQSRDAWLVGWADDLVRDLRYCVRLLARNPGFAAAAILTLALGIGANGAIFRLVDRVMLRSLPVQNPDELMVFRGVISYPRFERVRDRNQVFSGVFAASTLRDVELWTDSQGLGRGAVELVSGSYFTVLGVGTVLGRPFHAEDDRTPESRPVAVISHGLWTRAFGRSREVVGRPIRVRGGALGSASTSGFEPQPAQRDRPDGVVLTIVGVAPRGFFGDSVGTSVDVWIPMMMQPALMPGRAWLARNTASWVNVMGRRRPGVSEQQARASLTALWRQIRAEDIGPSISDEQRRSIAVATLGLEAGDRGFAHLRREFSQPLLVLAAVVALVLLIACLNVANLLLARATARRHEMSMRLSLGASHARLIRQALTESLVLAAAGGALGLLIAAAGTRILVTMVSGDRPIDLAFAADWRVLAFTASASMASAILFGLAPAWRTRDARLHAAVKDSLRTAAGGRSLLAKMLVAAQVAVSLVLVAGAGLFLRTLYNLKSQDVGYDRTGLLLLRVDPVAAGYRGEAIGRACMDLMNRLASLPGVGSVTFSENGLFSGTESATAVATEGFEPSGDADRTARFDHAGPGYFTTVGISLLAGRDLAATDRQGAPGVTVINQTMARFYFPSRNPIGRHIRVNADEASGVTLEVVGVARDALDHSFRQPPVRRFYVSYLQPIDGITTANFEIRTSSAATAIFPAVRQEVARFNPNLQILSLKSATALMDEDVGSERLIARLSSFFGALAVLLAVIGLYGVMSYTVARRTNEIGLRMALGARRLTVARMIVGELVVLVALGAAVGVLGGLALTRYVSSLMFGLTPGDPPTFAGAAGLLLIVGLVAAYLPARRAARIDPLAALRYE